jgi:hypothetical protein
VAGALASLGLARGGRGLADDGDAAVAVLAGLAVQLDHADPGGQVARGSEACVRLVDNAWTYITRHTKAPTSPLPTGTYSAYVITPDGDGDYDFALLTGNSDNTRSTLDIQG